MGLNAMVDTGSGIALDVEAAPARTADEPKAARIIVERMRARHGVVPTVMAADSAYGSAAFFGWAEDQGILLHAPVKETRPAGKRRQPPKEDFRVRRGERHLPLPRRERPCVRRAASEGSSERA